MNGVQPVSPVNGERSQADISPASQSSSYTVLTNHTGSSDGSYIIPNMVGTPERSPSQTSMTDFTLDQAMEKIQELAIDNANLRECLKDNNATAKKQYQTLLQWKEKVRESNKNNLMKFEELHRRISQLTLENEKYKEIFNSPEKEGSVLNELQRRLKNLEDEKTQTQREAEELRQKVEELKQQISNMSPDNDMVFVNKMDTNEMEALKSRCLELSAQVHNFHQQNEQLMLDLDQLRKIKQGLQEENSKLTEDNLSLQKKMQGLLGDLNNKSRQSVGGVLTSASESKGYDYTQKTEEEEQEARNSVTAKQDLQLLQQQTSIRGRESGEVILSGLAEDLKVKLTQERELTSQQKSKLSGQEMLISRLKSELAEKEKMLAHYKTQLETQLADMTQQHERQQQDLLRQLDGLNAQLQHRTSLEYRDEVQSLKSQVMSLIKEINETSTKLDATTKALDEKSSRIMKLESQNRQQAEQMRQSRMEADSLIQSLRYSLTSYEEAVIKEQNEHIITKNQFKDLRTSFNQLVNDYKELLDTFDDYKHKQQQSGPQNKQLLDDINRLTAQTIAAEEAIQYRDDQIALLKSENAKMKNDIDNTIPVLQAQAELWKQDFDAERGARERQAAEKDALLQEMKNLQTKNEQLMDELEAYSSKSLAEMQRRHAGPTYQQQMQNYLQNPGANMGPVYPPQRPSGQQHSPGLPQTGHQYTQYPPGDHRNYQQQQHQHQQKPQGPPDNNDDDAMICPQCGLSCPDLDTLQIHVADCIT